MKPARKLKITIVLSVSILLNVFLLWELKRSKGNSKVLKQEGQEIQRGKSQE